MQATSDSARHALQLPDADPADLAIDLVVTDAKDPQMSKKIGRLIRRENHADVYSVHDPDDRDECPTSNLEARAFALGGIPARLKGYRKRCIRRLKDRIYLQTWCRGVFVVVYRTDLPSGDNNEDAGEEEDIVEPSALSHFQDHILRTDGLDWPWTIDERSRRLSEECERDEALRGIMMDSFAAPSKQRFSLEVIWPKERLQGWLDIKTIEAGIPPPDQPQKTQFEREAARIKQLESRRRKRRQKRSRIVLEPSLPTEEKPPLPETLKADVPNDLHDQWVFRASILLYVAYDDKGDLRPLSLELDLPDGFINTPKLRAWVDSIQSHRRSLTSGLKNSKDLLWAHKARINLLQELKGKISEMGYRQHFSGVHSALSHLGDAGVLDILPAVKGKSPRREVLQHIQKVLPRLVNDADLQYFTTMRTYIEELILR